MADYRLTDLCSPRTIPTPPNRSMPIALIARSPKHVQSLTPDVCRRRSTSRTPSADDLGQLFTDGPQSAHYFVPIDGVDAVVRARIGRKKPPLKVLWLLPQYPSTTPSMRHYRYERFCQIIAEDVRTHDLTSPITHIPCGYTTGQVDWAVFHRASH